MKRSVIAATLFSVALAGGTGALLVLTLTNHAFMKTAFVNGSYYIVLALALIWAVVTLRFAAAEKLNPLRMLVANHLPGLVMSVLLAVMVFVTVKPAFRVLADETNLMGVAQAMTFEKKVDNITEGKFYYLNHQPIGRALEKRPLLFPFFVHLHHTILGYRVSNVFVMNFFVFAALLMLIYVLMRKGLGIWGSAAALVLVTAQPVVSACAASGGFELFQVLFIALSFASLWLFLKQPSSPERFQWLWMNLLMLSHARYESFIFLFVTLYLLFGFKYVRKDLAEKSWFCFAVTPLLFLPIVWQRILMIGQFQQPEGSAIFSLDYFLRYNWMFLRNLFNFKFFLPYANLLNLAALAAAVVFAWRIGTSKMPAERRTAHLIFFSAVNLAVSWIIFTSHFLGSMEVPSSARFFVLFSVVFSLGAAALFDWLLRRAGAPAAVLPLALVFLALYHPVAIENRYFNAQVVIREYGIVYRDFLRKLPNRNFLLISEYPNFYSVYQYPAVHFQTVEQRKNEILFEYNRRLYSEIYVVQKINYDSGQPSAGTSLDPMFQLSPIMELQNEADGFLRISKVVNQR